MTRKDAMEVKIEKLVYGGDGLGHQDGQTVFVPYVLPDEIIAVRPVERKKKFVRGRVDRIVSASAARIAAPCQHFTRCGGCHYQHMSYEQQVATKVQILRETLRRIGKLQWDAEIQVHASPPFGYRNRAQWKVRHTGEKAEIGYFQSSSTALCPVEECPILEPLLAEAFVVLRRLLQDDRLPTALREVEVFAGASSDQVLVNAELSDFAFSATRVADILRQAVPGVKSILLHDASRDHFELFGSGFVRAKIQEDEFRVGHFSFFQANRFLLNELCREVTNSENAASTGTALDLYAGIGTFTIPLARQFTRVLAVESNAGAARDLEVNIASSKVAARAVCKDVGKALSAQHDAPDLVVLDPPRAGVDRNALSALIALGPRRVHYLSCDPATLARDLAVLVAGGFRIEDIQFFDMFPQTFHIESLVRLSR